MDKQKQVKRARIMLVVSLVALILVVSSFFVSSFWGLAGRYLTLSVGTFFLLISFIFDIKENRKITKIIAAVLLAIFAVIMCVLGVMELIR